MPQDPEGPLPYLDALVAPLSDHERFAVTVGIELARLERLNEALFERSAADYGFTASEANTLTALLLAGPPHQLLPSEIRRRAAQTSSGVTDIMRRLESRGLIERLDAADGQYTVFGLTPAGDEVVRTFIAHRASELSSIFAEMSIEKGSDLVQSLSKVVARVEYATGDSHTLNRDITAKKSVTRTT